MLALLGGMSEGLLSDEDYEMAVDFRKDYDKLMDAVHYLSVMKGSMEEGDAIARLKAVYEANQDKWGG